MEVVLDRSVYSDQIGSWGEGHGAYVAQTFKASAAQLHSVEVQLATYQSSPGPSVFRVLVTTVETNTQGQHPGQVLFESGPLVDPPGPDFTYTKFAVDTGNLKLAPGLEYAIVLDFASDHDGTGSLAALSMSHLFGGTDYPDGGLLYLVDSNGNRGTDFSSDWVEGDADISFKLVFSSEGAVITGSKGKDLIDSSHAPNGQPFVTADDDRILGGKGNDKLFGLTGYDELQGDAGNDKLYGGDDGDLLAGGKGKDSLYGGTGHDFFVFDAGLSQPADALKDFNPAEDTIWLAQKVFKVLPLGVLSADAFRDVGESGSSADRVIYKSNGQLSYDKDGQGGSDGVVFAKLTSRPDIDASDFVVAA